MRPASKARARHAARPEARRSPQVSDQHDRRRLYPRHRGQQSDRAQRGGRPGPLPRFLIAALFAALAAVAGGDQARRRIGLNSHDGARHGRRHGRLQPRAGAPRRRTFILASLAALAATIGFRFVIAGKDRRLLQKSFALYLAPHVITGCSSNKLLNWREIRNVTVFFSDIEGFS